MRALRRPTVADRRRWLIQRRIASRRRASILDRQFARSWLNLERQLDLPAGGLAVLVDYAVSTRTVA